MKVILVTIISVFLSCMTSQIEVSNVQSKDTGALEVDNGQINKHVQLSIDFLEGVRAKENVEGVLKNLAQIDFDQLISSLNTKQKKLAFWVNLYNAFVQHELVNTPSLFEDKTPFYKDRRHKVAGINMSYDDFEHGILRNTRIKLSLGYLKNLTAPKWQRKLRNKDIDPRIHFALNCGAKDCPPIAIFNDVEVEAQLDEINRRYLKNHTTVVGNKVTTTPLFSWFRGDFGGKGKVPDFLIRYGAIPAGSDYELAFKSYDWTLDTDNYIDL